MFYVEATAISSSMT